MGFVSLSVAIYVAGKNDRRLRYAMYLCDASLTS